MSEVLTSCTYFGVLLTIAAFLFGLWCKRKFGWAICNPLLIAVIVVMGVLLAQ